MGAERRLREWLLHERVPVLGADAYTYLLEKERQDIPSTPVCGLKDRGAGFPIYKGKEKAFHIKKGHKKGAS